MRRLSLVAPTAIDTLEKHAARAVASKEIAPEDFTEISKDARALKQKIQNAVAKALLKNENETDAHSPRLPGEIHEGRSGKTTFKKEVLVS